MYKLILYSDADNEGCVFLCQINPSDPRGKKLYANKGCKLNLLNKKARKPDAPVLVITTPDGYTRVYLRGEVKSLSDRRDKKVSMMDMPVLRKNLLQEW